MTEAYAKPISTSAFKQNVLEPPPLMMSLLQGLHADWNVADPDRAKSTIVTISHTLTHAMCHYPASTYHLCTEKSIVLYALIRPNSQNKLGFHYSFVVQQKRFQKTLPNSIAFFLSLSHFFKSLFRKCVGSFCSGHMVREWNHYESLKGPQISERVPNTVLGPGYRTDLFLIMPQMLFSDQLYCDMVPKTNPQSIHSCPHTQEEKVKHCNT